MTTLISKRHKLKFYLTVILGSLFFFIMGTVVLIGFLKNKNNEELKLKQQLMPVLSIGVYFIGFYTIYKYYKNAPHIQLDETTISFNNQIFALVDLERIDLTGKRNFPYLGRFPMEAATLQFQDGQTKYIFDDMYENTWELKLFLKRVVIDKKKVYEHNKQTVGGHEMEGEWYDTFKGNQFTSLREYPSGASLAFSAT